MDHFCDRAGSDRDCDMEILSVDGGVSGKRIVCFVSAPIRNETERFSSMEKVYLLSLKSYLSEQEPGEQAAAHRCAGNICRPGLSFLVKNGSRVSDLNGLTEPIQKGHRGVKSSRFYAELPWF